MTLFLQTWGDHAKRIFTKLFPFLRSQKSNTSATKEQSLYNTAGNAKSAVIREHLLLDNIMDVVCSIDTKNRFRAVSPASKIVWGYEPAELIGTNLSDLIISEGATPTPEAVRLDANRKTCRFENKMRHKDGRIIDVLWSICWLELENELFCVAHDITERKAAEKIVQENEARIRLIVENMPVGLIIADENGVIELSNSAAQQMFGHSGNKMQGKHIMMLFPRSSDQISSTGTDGQSTFPAEPEAFMNVFKQKLMTGPIETQGWKHNDESFPIELSLNHLNMNEKQKLLISVIDVSQRHELERFKKELVAIVSHDLRTPLTSVQGNLTILSREIWGELPPKCKPLVDRSERELRRLIELINNLLDIEKMEAGKFYMQFEPTCIATVIEESLEVIDYLGKAKDIEIVVQHGDNEILADSNRLMQVMVNLLSNAINFSPPGSRISVRVIDEPQTVRVVVTDQGCGIPLSDQSLIFEKFQQAKSNAQRSGTSGLGLAICKAIIEQHGGTIGLESEEGKGSIFWFRLPKHR